METIAQVNKQEPCFPIKKQESKGLSKFDTNYEFQNVDNLTFKTPPIMSNLAAL